jgi:hypothetical protein
MLPPIYGFSEARVWKSFKLLNNRKQYGESRITLRASEKISYSED